MSDPSLALQNALEAALRGSPEVLAAMELTKVRLYTLTAPVGAPFPYLVIGEDQVIDDSTECAESSEVITTTRVFTRVDGSIAKTRAQAKRIAGVVRSVLKGIGDVPGFVEGFDVVLADFEATRHLTERDGLTCQSIVEHRFLLDPA